MKWIILFLLLVTPVHASQRTFGDHLIDGDIEIDGSLNHDGGKIGFFASTPTVQASAYTITNLTIDKTFDADSTTVAELADIIGSLFVDLKSYGLLIGSTTTPSPGFILQEDGTSFILQEDGSSKIALE